MNIKDLLKRYTFHDSLVEMITYNQDSRTLTLTIDFCYWMQEGYIASTPENGLVKLTFLEVDSYDCLTGNLDSYSILRVTYQDNNTFISILDDFNNDYYPIKIPSDKVIFQTI